MSKRIVICSDGTGNTAIKGRGTNVFKTFEAIDLNGHRFDPSLTPQVALYDDGVGTESFKPLKLFAGMTGFGLGRNVTQLYRELVRIYDPGDEIYVFGFSRGAYTVRSLVGLIANCGILDLQKLERKSARGLNAAAKQAYHYHRQCFRTELVKLFLGPPKDDGAAFRKRYSLDTPVRIRFVGVWDTVDAVGMPFHLGDMLNNAIYRFKFPDFKLSPCVDRACHALAIDDERHSFSPLLWDERDEKEQRIEQVWFSGAHSNVGGGYPKQGMSLVALDWMLARAERAGLRLGAEGLRLNAPDRDLIRTHASVDDKLYDPRAGLGIFYRWKIRDIGALCKQNGVVPKLHMSVLERVAHGTDNYSPGNLPPDANVMFTDPGRDADRVLLSRRARNLERVLRTAYAGEGPLLARPRVRVAMRVGLLSYYLYLLSCTAVLLAVAGGTKASALLHPLQLLQSIGERITDLLASPFATALAMLRDLLAQPGLLALLLGGFALAGCLAMITDHIIGAVFSEWWFHHQPKLREALKEARQETLFNQQPEELTDQPVPTQQPSPTTSRRPAT